MNVMNVDKNVMNVDKITPSVQIDYSLGFKNVS
jgi:hypothetical protein